MKKLLLLLLPLMLLFTACSPQDAKDVENSIVIALSSEPEEGFDPCLGWGKDGNPLFQSSLLKLDKDMNLQCDIATNYTHSEDSLTWTFQIRDDIKFSDGTNLTAEDVAFTYETARNSASIVDLTVIDKINVVDDTTIEFILKHPQIAFLTTASQIGIVPEASYDENYSQNPIGSGPFKMLQWDKGEQVIMGINEYYYGQKPNFERVTILFMSDDTAYSAALNGDVDVCITNMTLADNTIDGMDLERFDTIDNRGLTLPAVEDTGLKNSYDYPIGNAVTSDKYIRQALSYGINRDELVTNALNSYGTPAYSECDGMPWASEDAYVEYNPEYAIKILEDNGWILGEDGIRYKDGLKAEFTLLYSSADSARQALSFAVASNAKEIGINILPHGTSWDEINKLMNSNAVLMGFGSQNPMQTYYLYHSSYAGLGYHNPEYYTSEITDNYLLEALAKTDYDEFLEIYKKVQWNGETGVSSQGECPFLWLVNVDHLYFINKNLDIKEQKIHPHGQSWPLLSNLNEWEWKTND